MVPRVADDETAGGRVRHFGFTGDGRIEGGEEKLRRIADRLQRRDAQGADLRRQGRGEPPCELVVALAGGSFACGQPRGAEPRMLIEQPDELLSHDARGT